MPLRHLQGPSPAGGVEGRGNSSTNGFRGNGSAGNGSALVRRGESQRSTWPRSTWPESPARVPVSVVIPALNEEHNLPHVLPRIPSWVDEVVLVDGGSEDRTVEVARELVPDIRVVHEPRSGKGVALQSGFHNAGGEIIVTLDADGSTDPAEIPAFVGCLLAGADFAKGSRFVQGAGTTDMSLLRQTGNWCLQRLVRVAFGGRYSDLCYGYNAFWRHVLPVIDGNADGFEIETLMNVRVLAAGLRVTEVASHEGSRIHGRSHLRTFPDGWRVLRTIIRERIRTLKPTTRLPRNADSDDLPESEYILTGFDRRSGLERRNGSAEPSLEPSPTR